MSTESKVPVSQAKKGRTRSSYGGFAIGVLVVVAVAGGGWYWRMHGATLIQDDKARSTSNPSTESSDAIPVQTTRLAPGGITRISAQIGSVHPAEEAELYAKISGYLKELHVDYGSRVKRGELLAVIDDPEVIEDANKAAADVAQANAAVAQALAFIESAKADRDAASSAVDQSIAEVGRYTSARSYHEKKFARYQELVKNKAIPQQIADEEEESYESARAAELASQKAVLNAKAQLNASIARVRKAEADLAEAKANVQVEQAKLARAKVFVEYTKITSPYDGVITKRNFFRGAFIRSAVEGGLVPLLDVARTDKVRVITAVPDRDVPLTNVGDPAEVTLDAIPGQVFKGTVSRFADAEDPTSRTMHTEIDLPNEKDQIKPGMYGIAKIILDRETKNSTLPSSCLIGDAKGGKANVYVVADGKVKKVSVEIGSDDGIRVEILSGLTPKDEVILNTGSVTENAPVRIVR